MRHLCLALVLAAVPAVAHATPFEPATIPQQAEAAGHLDVDAMRSTQLFTMMGGQGAVDAIIDDAPVDLKPLLGPLAKSVRAVSFWHAKDHSAVHVATRDRGAVSNLLARAPVKRGVPVDGAATFTLEDKGHKGHDKAFLAAAGDTLVLSDSYDALAQSLRVLANKAPNLVGARALASVARTGVFVFVTIGDGVLNDLQKSSPSKLMQLGAKQIVIDASEAGGTLTANARAELSSADALAKAKTIVDGMKALATLSDDADATRLISGVTVASNGLTLTVSGKWAVADLKGLIEKARKHQ